MNNKTSFELINTRDESVVAKYENALYRAFSNSYIKTLDRIWNIDHKNKRIKTVVPYDFQQIIALKIDGSEKYLAGMSINYDLNHMQLEQMGFKIDKSRSSTCEVLYMFSLADYIGGVSPLQILSAQLMKEINARGIKYLYGTCSLRRLNAYTLLGFRNIDRQIFEGEEKFLLEMIMGKDSFLEVREIGH